MVISSDLVLDNIRCVVVVGCIPTVLCQSFSWICRKVLFLPLSFFRDNLSAIFAVCHVSPLLGLDSSAHLWHNLAGNSTIALH